MERYNRRLTEIWTYPPICKYYDRIGDLNKFISFLDSESEVKDTLIYIHIPYCDSLCFFCAYYKESVAKNSYYQRKKLFSLYVKEIEKYAQKTYFRDVKIKAIQFGGGTPTSIEVEFLKILIDTIWKNFDCSQCEIISCEGNVMSLKDQEKVSELLSIGVNRISFGIQTFDASIRKNIGLKASVQDIYETIQCMRDLDFYNFSVDLMYNLPDQTLESVKNDLQIIHQLEPVFIDIYNLNIFPNTLFRNLIESDRFTVKPTDQREIEMCNYIIQWFLAENYHQVMVNTFSQKRKAPPVNLDLYLNGSNVLGIGPSSRSFLKRRNYCNVPIISEYRKKLESNQFPIIAGNQCTDEELIERKLVFFPNYTYVEKKEILNITKYRAMIDFLIKNNYIIEDEKILKLTEKGKIFPGNISLLFFNEIQKQKRLLSFMKTYQNKENPYNQDKMLVKI